MKMLPTALYPSWLSYLFVQSAMHMEDVDLLTNEFNISSVMEESVSEVNPAKADNLDENCGHNIWPLVPEAFGIIHLCSFRPQSYQLDIKIVKTQVLV